MKMRHYLNVYHLMPDFPRPDDLLFELSQSDGIGTGKKTFDYNGIKSILTFKITKTFFNQAIQFLIDENLVKKVKNDSYKLIR